MVIELSYWDMFWIGVTVGWILCWYVPVLSNIKLTKTKPINTEERQEMFDMKTLGYLPVPEFKYQPTQYFKHVPVKDLRSHNQGEVSDCGGEYDCEIGKCLTCLKLYAREKNGKGSSHCDWCIKSSKIRSNPPLPKYNTNK